MILNQSLRLPLVTPGKTLKISSRHGPPLADLPHTLLFLCHWDLGTGRCISAIQVPAQQHISREFPSPFPWLQLDSVVGPKLWRGQSALKLLSNVPACLLGWEWRLEHMLHKTREQPRPGQHNGSKTQSEEGAGASMQSSRGKAGEPSPLGQSHFPMDSQSPAKPPFLSLGLQDSAGWMLLFPGSPWDQKRSQHFQREVIPKLNDRKRSSVSSCGQDVSQTETYGDGCREMDWRGLGFSKFSVK